MSKSVSKASKVFDVTSPGFTYALIVALLTVLTGVFGINFPGTPEQIAGDVVTSLNGFGIFAVVSVILSSIVLPIWNARTTAGFSWKKLFYSRLTWLAIVNIILAILALFGLVFPEGTAEALFNAIGAKDWTAVIVIFFNVVLPTIIRFIKDKLGTGNTQTA